METQIIGVDFGRGYTKAYSEIGKEKYEVMFKSVFGDGRDKQINYSQYDNPIFVEFNDRQYFVGLLAEKESYSPIRNGADSKVSKTVEILLASVLEQIAVKDRVKLMFGVTYKDYAKSVLKEIVDKYKGKTIRVKNLLNGSSKKIFIEDVDIFREGDAALYHALNGENNSVPTGLVSVGFRTMELVYLDKGFNFNDKLSDTIEYGNSTMLTIVKDILLTKNISKTVNEIDSSEDYEDMKLHAYALGSERIDQMVEEIWHNKDEMKLYIAGGTSLYLNPSDKFTRLPDAQMATAKGLFEIANSGI